MEIMEFGKWVGESDMVSVIPEYSKREVRNAGRILARGSADAEEYARAIEIADNWRAAHAVPLQTFYMHFRKKYGQYIVAQRLKRIPSIVSKLERFPDMGLDRMQDLGGCRVIVNSIYEVFRVVEDYKQSSVRHVLHRSATIYRSPSQTGIVPIILSAAIELIVSQGVRITTCKSRFRCVLTYSTYGRLRLK